MSGRKRPTFDQEAVFKSIIGAGHQEDSRQKQELSKTAQVIQREKHRKGRPKTENETKKRVTLALYPSIYGDLQKIAYVKRKSISKIVSELITSYIDENTDTLHEYDLIQKD